MTGAFCPLQGPGLRLADLGGARADDTDEDTDEEGADFGDGYEEEEEVVPEVCPFCSGGDSMTENVKTLPILVHSCENSCMFVHRGIGP